MEGAKQKQIEIAKKINRNWQNLKHNHLFGYSLRLFKFYQII